MTPDKVPDASSVRFCGEMPAKSLERKQDQTLTNFTHANKRINFGKVSESTMCSHDAMKVAGSLCALRFSFGLHVKSSKETSFTVNCTTGFSLTRAIADTPPMISTNFTAETIDAGTVGPQGSLVRSSM